tara:strand:+ start:4204 stop:4770 length:567 start_codon:yes stop_codon:yes gene_type:complete
MLKFKEKSNLILSEITNVLSQVNETEVNKFIDLFENHSTSRIVIAGAGRMGYAAKGFAMRLGHLGYQSWALGDSTVPHIGQDDLLIVASGSGNTQTIYDVSKRAKENGANIALITNNPDSRIGKLTSTILVLPNNNNKEFSIQRTSQQPMTTLNEQCLVLLFDSLVLMIMDETGETHDTMWHRHSNLE